jgi:hypothetical protein
MTVWLEHREKIEQHADFIIWRQHANQCIPLSQNQIGPPCPPAQRLKMARNPSVKAEFMCNIIEMYGVANFADTRCNAPSGVLGSPMWTCEVTQGNSKGSRVQGGCVEHRGLLRDWDNTRSSPYLSVVTLGCLDGGGKRGGGQGCYSRRLGQRPGTDTTSRVEFKEELGLNLLGGEGTH